MKLNLTGANIIVQSSYCFERLGIKKTCFDRAEFLLFVSRWLLFSRSNPLSAKTDQNQISPHTSLREIAVYCPYVATKS